MRALTMVCLTVTFGAGVAGCMNSAALPATPTVKTPRPQRDAVAPVPAHVAGPSVAHEQPPTIAGIGNVVIEADNPWKPAVNARNWKYMVLHHTASDRGSVASIHEAHRRRKDSSGKPWLGIGYHFVIGNGKGMKDGEIQPTFRWTKQLHGAHAGVSDYNQRGIGIVLVGNFEQHAPTAAQLKSARRLVRTLQTAYSIKRSDIVTHGAIKNTACPGRHFSLARITQLDDGITIGTAPSLLSNPVTFADSRDVQ